MEKNILVTYATNSGSTREVAEAVAGELVKNGLKVDVLDMDEVRDVSSFSGVIIGAPMILGWHRGAVKFLKKHQAALSRVPTAYFLTAMSLTRNGEQSLNGVPLYFDPYLVKAPGNPNRLSRRERYATVSNYLGPVLKKAPEVRPASAAFFAGKVDYSRLKLPQMLFVMLVIGAQPADRRNWQAIREWAGSLPEKFTNGSK
jgi:menaquinone-dependent protoporphyrinogen oxidase